MLLSTSLPSDVDCRFRLPLFPTVAGVARVPARVTRALGTVGGDGVPGKSRTTDNPPLSQRPNLSSASSTRQISARGKLASMARRASSSGGSTTVSPCVIMSVQRTSRSRTCVMWSGQRCEKVKRTTVERINPPLHIRPLLCPPSPSPLQGRLAQKARSDPPQDERASTPSRPTTGHQKPPIPIAL